MSRLAEFDQFREALAEMGWRMTKGTSVKYDIFKHHGYPGIFTYLRKNIRCPMGEHMAMRGESVTTAKKLTLHEVQMALVNCRMKNQKKSLVNS